MTALREMAQKVLTSTQLQRCFRGYSEDTGEYEDWSCKAEATHRITSPHEDQRWDYCEKCAREIHANIKYNYRWSLRTIPGLEGVIAARELAKAVLNAETAQYFARDMVFHHLLHHPLPWRDEHDWTHEVTAADGTIIVKCMTAAQAAAVIAMAEEIRAELDTPAEDSCA
jgi:hypothetical protein